MHLALIRHTPRIRPAEGADIDDLVRAFASRHFGEDFARRGVDQRERTFLVQYEQRLRVGRACDCGNECNFVKPHDGMIS